MSGRLQQRAWRAFTQSVVRRNFTHVAKLEPKAQRDFAIDVLKRAKNLTISLAFPTLNEEATIAKEILVIKTELMDRFPLIDEIAVIDSGSTDKTRETARRSSITAITLAASVDCEKPSCCTRKPPNWIHSRQGRGQLSRGSTTRTGSGRTPARR